MKYLILSLLIPFVILATDSKENKENLPKEKNIKVINPIIVEKLDKELKDEKDIKKSVKKGAGEKDGSKIIDPHNLKDVKDNKIKTQNINSDEIDPQKFMIGLGDKKEKDKNNKDLKENNGKVINPNSTENPFNDKKLVQNINTKKYLDIVDISGNVGVRVNVRDDDNNTGNTFFELQNEFNLSFSKDFTSSDFRITLGTLSEKINNDWVTISTIQGNKLPIGLKEAFYTRKDITGLLNTRMGRFFSPMEDDYFFSKSLSFDGVNIYGSTKSGLYYKLLLSALQNENVFTDDIDIASLSTVNLGFKNDNLNVSLYYTWLYGKTLDTLFNGLSNGETYSTQNHYLAGFLSYALNLNENNKLTFQLGGSFNFSKDKDNLGGSFSIKHETKTLLSKLTILYKQQNSVISPLSLQEEWFTNDVMGGSFKFMYKYDEAMSSGIEFSAGKSIINSDSDLNYITRAVYNINF